MNASRFKTIAAALVLGSAASAASATYVTTSCPNTPSTADREYSVSTLPGATCLAFGDGNIGNGRNDQFLAGHGSYRLIESDEQNNYAGGLFLTGIGAANGYFSIKPSLYPQYDSFALGFKSGANLSPEYAVFGLGSLVTAGAWSMSRNSLSHAVLYGHVATPMTPPAAGVPAPGMLALMGIGLVGMGGSLRARRNARQA